LGQALDRAGAVLRLAFRQRAHPLAPHAPRPGYLLAHLAHARNAVEDAARDTVRGEGTERRVLLGIVAIDRLEQAGIGVLIELGQLDVAALLLAMMAPGDALGESGMEREQPLARFRRAALLERAPQRRLLGGLGREGLGRHHRKLPRTPCRTRLQPSIITNIKSLIGSESVEGGTISMPSA